ncbi:DNA-directed RNA polymerase III subunit RPC6 [Trichonephila clavipes]|nr:DNA-directed RNA polymerase III subunit RPC6 [Trichonephila clavipes]
MDLENCVLDLIIKNPNGVTNKMLQTANPSTGVAQLVEVINKLTASDKIQIFHKGKQLVYMLKNPDSAKHCKGADIEEKLIYQHIEKAGNKGIWVRDLRFASNIPQTQVNKILKTLESKKLIKSVTSVAASKKKVYMLYNIEPDRSVTGGTWYSDQEFESEFVDVLNQQCYRYLLQAVFFYTSRKYSVRGRRVVKVSDRGWPCHKFEPSTTKDLHKAVADKLSDPVSRRRASFKSSKDICDYINGLKVRLHGLEFWKARARQSCHTQYQYNLISSPGSPRRSTGLLQRRGFWIWFSPAYLDPSKPLCAHLKRPMDEPALVTPVKVQLSKQDIETILDTLVFDGKVEKSSICSSSVPNEEISENIYGVIKPLISDCGLMRVPCGVCPVHNECRDGGIISPTTCPYMKEWLEY